MLPKSLLRDEFGARLSEVVSPAIPIQSVEHLHGRAQELDKIEKALYAPGRHVFIYGDKGVGKSSLAAAAANQLQSADAPYIDVGCTPDSTLQSVVANIAYQAMNTSRLKATQTTASGGVKFRYLQAGLSHQWTPKDLFDEIHTIGDAVEILREVAVAHSKRPIVVIDEFQQISDPAQQDQFAYLIKQMSDKKVGLQFIFTGVGEVLEKLLGAHGNAIRQLATIQLARLGWEGRWEIAVAAAKRFGLFLPKNLYVRIAAISDGFPYYVHLLTEHMLWAVFDDPETVSEISADHLMTGVRAAIENILAEVDKPYKLATQQREPDYEEVLWSTADSEYLDRYASDMFSSYLYVMNQRKGRTPLSRDRYAARLRSLRTDKFGHILVPDRAIRGLYTYRDRMLRGYVRMQAEANGVQLLGEKPPPKQVMHVPGSAGKGYHTSRVPDGVHMGRRRDPQVDDDESDSDL